MSWLLKEKVRSGDGESYDYFGHAVAMSGNNAIIGAYVDDASRPGYAGIFHVDSSDTGNELGTPLPESPFLESGSTTFIWSTSSNAVNYGIWICDASFSSIFFGYYSADEVENGDTCSVSIDPAYFNTGTLYYWYIGAYAGDGSSKWSWESGGMAFWYNIMSLPSVPVAYSPSGATQSADFTWSASPGALGYSVWICDTTFSSVFYAYYSASEAENGNTCSVKVDPSYFETGKTYYWFVCASTIAGQSWNWDSGGLSFFVDSAPTKTAEFADDYVGLKF